MKKPIRPNRKPGTSTSNPPKQEGKRVDATKRSNRSPYHLKDKGRDMVSSLVSRSRALMRWAWEVSFETLTGSPMTYFEFYLGRLELIHLTRGLMSAVSWAKETRAFFGRWISIRGNPKDKDYYYLRKKLRTRLGIHLFRKIESMEPSRWACFAMTLLTVTRCWTTSPKPKLGPIESGWLILDGKPSFRGWPNLIRSKSKFWRALGVKSEEFGEIPRSSRFEGWYFTTKSGPNGHALWNSLLDLSILPPSLINSLITVGGTEFEGNIRALIRNLPKLMVVFPQKAPKRKLSLRRLSCIQDRECKTRVIAILDYFSQSVLKPVHSYLFNLLRDIPQDCTFDQNSFKDKTKDWPCYYSVDLTSATDRFPIWLIVSLLETRFGSEWARAWQDIMVGYPFSYKGRDDIVYSVGNPMGAYSSWASFAITHHFIFFLISETLGIKWSSMRYVVLGDDVVIGDHSVAQCYKQILRDLGVDWDPIKSHESVHTLEFAKRWLSGGVEFTPLPLDGIFESSANYVNFTITLIQEERKGFAWSSDLSDAYARLKQKLGGRRSWVRGFKRKVRISEIMARVLMGALPAARGLTLLFRQLAPSLAPIHSRWLKEENALGMLENIAVELFADSNSPKKRERPLGLMAERAVMLLTDPANGFDDLWPYQVPHLYAHGLVEEQYLDVQKRIEKANFGADWPILLKAMTIPRDDRVYWSQRNDILPSGVGRTVQALEERFVILSQYPQLLDGCWCEEEPPEVSTPWYPLLMS